MRGIWLIVMLFWLQGCQSSELATGMRDLPEEHFQDLWRVSEHCRVSHDVEEIRRDAELLSRAAFANEGQASSVSDLLAPWVEAPPVRLSVEPKSMAAACAIRGGRMAWQAGHEETARRLYSLVVRRFHEPHLAFYVREADAGLVLVEREAITSHFMLVDSR
jgi:hypothetical protein